MGCGAIRQSQEPERDTGRSPAKNFFDYLLCAQLVFYCSVATRSVATVRNSSSLMEGLF